MPTKTTFACRQRDPHIFEAWRHYAGVWRCEAPGRRLTLALAPRRPRPSCEDELGTLSGFYGLGEERGVFFFEAQGYSSSERTLFGHHCIADRRLRPKAAQLEWDAAARPDSPSDSQHLRLRFGGRRYDLERVAPLADEPLSRVCILGHRGLGFDSLDNKEAAFRFAWYFGASALEMDLTLPRTERPFRHETLKVYHPPGLAQTVDASRYALRRHLTLEEFFDGLARGEYPTEHIYLDPKVGWLNEVDTRALLRYVARVSRRYMNHHPGVTISIAATNANAARVLGGIEQGSILRHQRPVSWTLEWTEVGEASELYEQAGTLPRSLSFSLFRIKGSGKSPWIEWTMEDLSRPEERALGALDHPLVFWTANTEEHFEGVLRAATHRERFGRSVDRGRLAIMTDEPHRLALWLASAPHD